MTTKLFVKNVFNNPKLKEMKREEDYRLNVMNKRHPLFDNTTKVPIFLQKVESRNRIHELPNVGSPVWYDNVDVKKQQSLIRRNNINSIVLPEEYNDDNPKFKLIVSPDGSGMRQLYEDNIKQTNHLKDALKRKAANLRLKNTTNLIIDTTPLTYDPARKIARYKRMLENGEPHFGYKINRKKNSKKINLKTLKKHLKMLKC